MTEAESTRNDKIRSFIVQDVASDVHRKTFESDEFWAALEAVGTQLWLDTGDIDAASELWTREMSALTTNNTLLNREVQKGIYDDFIRDANLHLGDLERSRRILEIAFILNARHGLRLVERFGGLVSVELHTDLSYDLAGIVEYGKRFHEISPSHFVVKVPFTATGLIGARMLREADVPVNLTLGFSARQNVLASLFAKPNYCNVFLGRLNSFVADHDLGSGDNVGEKATLASQRAVRDAGSDLPEPTRQIAASMRYGSQVERLAGVDVFTMPTSVAKEAHETLAGTFTSRVDEDYEVSLADGVDPNDVRLSALWEVRDEIYRLAEDLDDNPPSEAAALTRRARDLGCGDLFPTLTEADRKRIQKDGKIPSYDYWRDRIQTGEVSVDTIMNFAGLATFTSDQKELDERVAGLIG
jgi:transaldolase